ncbi:hypothetical protein I4U23_011025 [Adineta vaga]|nr:hypothetical protein I4U23_011025 [Adineta vaga]
MKIICKQLTLPICIFDIVGIEEKSSKDLSTEQSTFVWFELLTDLLFRMKQTEKSKLDMIEQCRLVYKDNEKEKITKFQTTYKSVDAIRWYTDDSFLYKLLNKAFRTETFDIIFKFRFFYQRFT